MIDIEIVSDLVCPWCFIDKRQLEAALQRLHAERPDASTRIAWLPFELNPQMPLDRIDRKTYRIRKFDSLARSQSLDASVTQAAAEVGLGDVVLADLAGQFDALCRAGDWGIEGPDRASEVKHDLS